MGMQTSTAGTRERLATMTIRDVVKFIYEQRAIHGADKVFPGWSDADIALNVNQAIRLNAFGWVLTNDRITGLAFGIPRSNEKLIDITQVCCASPRDLAHLLLLFKTRFPGWHLRGRRKKKAEAKQIMLYVDIDKMLHKAQVVAMKPLAYKL